MSKTPLYPLFLGLTAALASTAVYFAVKHVYVGDEKQKKTGKGEKSEGSKETPASKRRIIILYGTTTGTAKTFSGLLDKRIKQSSTYIPVTKIVNLADFDAETLSEQDIVLIISSTWTDGKSPESCFDFFDYVQEYAYDFRVSKDHLSKITFAVFGLGGEIYGENYCKAVIDLNEHLKLLSATPIMEVGMGDDQTDIMHKFNKWCSNIVSWLCKEDGPTVVRVKKFNEEETEEYKELFNHQKEKKKRVRTKKEDRIVPKGTGSSFMQQQKDVKALFEKKKPAPKPVSVPIPVPVAVPVPQSAEVNPLNGMEVNNGSSCCNDKKEGEAKKGGSCCNNHDHGDSNKKDIKDDPDVEEEDILNDWYVQIESADRNSQIPLNKNQIVPAEDEISDDERDSEKDNDKIKDPSKNKASKTDTDEIGHSSAGPETKEGGGGQGLADVEDIGSKMSQGTKNRLKEDLSSANGEKREMVTKLQRKALTKEGYRIIGTIN